VLGDPVLLEEPYSHHSVQLAGNTEYTSAARRCPACHVFNGRAAVPFRVQDKLYCADVAHNRSVRRGLIG
jgi:hypothetical protein